MEPIGRIFSGNRTILSLSFAVLLTFLVTGTAAYGANSQITQCANDTSPHDGIIDACKWITGALGTSNSDYAESDGVPQRWFFEHTSSGSVEDHTAVFQYTFTKNSYYAYDFLVDVNHTMPMSLINPCANLAPFVAPDDCVNAFATAVNAPIPDDTFDSVASREHPPFPNRNILFGCVEEGGSTFACSNVSVDPPVHVPNTNCFQNCGDSIAQITVHFQTPASGTHLISMYLSGQLAIATDPDGAGPAIGWGATGCGPSGNDPCGSSSAPGASFHFRLVTLDGQNIGGQDNQINSDLIEQSHNSDLEVTKTCPGTVVKGNNVSYTITANNNGPDTATNAFIDDTLPIGTNFVSATTSQGTCTTLASGTPITALNNVMHCSIGFMEPNTPVTITVVVTVPSGFAGSSITDAVLVGGAVIDPNSALVCTNNHSTSCTSSAQCVFPGLCLTNNTATCTTALTNPTPPVDLSVSKSCPGTAIAGDPSHMTYTVTVTNNSGTTAATNVVLIDSLPGGVTYFGLGVTNDFDSCNQSSGVVTCSLSSLAASSSASVQIIVDVGPSVRGTITNTATVSGNQTDNNTANNTYSCNTTVNGQIDLAVTKTCPDPSTVDAGSQITYHIQVDNAGPSTSLDTHIEDLLPNNGLTPPTPFVTYLSATVSQGSGCTIDSTGTLVHCVLGNIAPGGNATVDILVQIKSTVPDSTVLTNDAHIHVHNNEEPAGTCSTSGGSCMLDSDCPSGETCSTGLTSTCDVTVQVPETCADLSVTKTDDGPVNAGEDLTYTITVANDPTNDAHNVTLTDTLPAGVIFDSYSSASFTCSESSGVVTCGPLATLAANTNATLNITVHVDPSIRGTITNTVTVAESEADCNTNDNSFTKDTEVNGSADLSITKSDSPDPVSAGQNLTYTLLVTNNGPSDATDVQVVDTLPAGVGGTFIVASATQGTGCIVSLPTVTCNLGTISPGDTATITITVSVDIFPPLDQTVVITNSAVVSGTEPDPNPDNNTATEDTTIYPPTPVPTLSEWGMIIFMLLAGLTAVYCLRRQKRI